MDHSYIKTKWKFYGYFPTRNRIQWRKWLAENDKFESLYYLQIRKNTKKELIDIDRGSVKLRKIYEINYKILLKLSTEHNIKVEHTY